MEIQILNFIQNIRTSFLDQIMIFITHLGSAGIIWIILTTILLLYPKTRKIGIILTIALFIDLLLCNIILKNIVARPRPFNINTAIELIINAPTDYSFPSGHTSASFSVVSVLYILKHQLWKPSLILAIMIAFSRMYLYVHYPTDIIGGIICGIVCGYLGYKCYNVYYLSQNT
ncbi:MAG: phosphatase PAP2 family protein [Erysipelotrichaceae bacterium]|nr:phosphatase PAP2 family protein [Erysipelotrichaceae bacterium]